MTDNDFSSWFPWTSRNKIRGVKNPGIYVLAISGKDISNQPFSWRDEIVYIGMTNSSAGLKGRLQQFDNTINGKTGHGGAGPLLIGSDLKIAILEHKEGRMAVNLCVGMNWLNGGGHSPPYGTPVFRAVNGDGFTFRGVAI